MIRPVLTRTEVDRIWYYGAGRDRDRNGLAGFDGVATAWFDAPSLIEGAALAGRVVELSAEIVVDLRATGIRVRLDSDKHAEAVSAAARDLGLAANPAALQHLSIVFEFANPTAVRQFWQRAFDYAPGEDGGLTDQHQAHAIETHSRTGGSRSK